MIKAIVVVSGAALLFGFFFGWLVGHAAGFIDGRESEKQAALEKSHPGN